MRRLFLLTVRELRAYLQSPVTWIIFALAWFLVGLLYRGRVIPASEITPGQIDILFMTWLGTTQAIFIQVLLVPLLTMRLLAEERRTGTYEMLVTAPVRDHEIVLGKFMAAFLVNCALWIVLPIYATIVKAAGGSPDFGPVWAAYLGIVGVGALFTSLGLLASSLTRHQIMAGFLGVVLILGVIYLPYLPGIVAEGWTWLSDIAEIGNLMKQTEESARGLIDFVHIAYQSALSALFLLFTVRIVEARKWA